MGDNKYSRNGTRESYRRRSIALLESLPVFCQGYFAEQSKEHEPSTVYCYLLGIKVFFQYLQDKGLCHVTSIKEITPADLERLKGTDLSLYVDCLTNYGDNSIKHKIIFFLIISNILSNLEIKSTLHLFLVLIINSMETKK